MDRRNFLSLLAVLPFIKKLPIEKAPLLEGPIQGLAVSTIVYDDPISGRVMNKEYALGFTITKEMLDDCIYRIWERN